MNNKERGEKIWHQIVRDVIHHPSGISRYIANIFSRTPQAVNNHIKPLVNEGWLSSLGREASIPNAD